MANRGGVYGQLIGAGAEDRAALIDRGDAATRRERDRQLGGDAANCFEKCGAMVARRGDIEDDEFVSAFDVVTRRERGWISGIAQIDELHALDDALTVGVQARNDAVREAHGFLPARRTKFESTCAPAGPDFSG